MKQAGKLAQKLRFRPRAPQHGTGLANIPLQGTYGVAPISAPIRATYLGLIGLMTLVVFVGPLFSSTLQGSTRMLLAFSNVLVMGMLAVPFLRNDWREGWLNPVILFSVVAFVNILAKRSGLMLVGLHEHEVIFKGADRLTQLVAYEQFLESLAMGMLYVGYAWFPHMQVPRFAAPQNSPVLGATVIMLVLSLGALLTYITYSGSLSEHITNLALNRASKNFVTDDVGWLGALAATGMQAHLGLLFLLAYRPRITINPIFYVLLLAAIGIILISTGKRASIIYPMIMMGLIWTGVNGKVPYFRAIVGLVFCIFLIGFLGAIRGELMSQKYAENRAAQKEGGPLVVMQHAFEEMSVRVGSYSSRLCILDSVPHEVPLQLGYTYLGWIARPIPRAIWPGKPTGTDSYVARTFFGVNWGIPSGGVGEAYWNFHIPGVMMVYFLFGVFKRWWRNLFMSHPGNPGLLVLYILTMFIFGAPSDTQFTQWLFAIAPAIVILFFLGGLRTVGRGSA